MERFGAIWNSLWGQGSNRRLMEIPNDHKGVDRECNAIGLCDCLYEGSDQLSVSDRDPHLVIRSSYRHHHSIRSYFLLPFVVFFLFFNNSTLEIDSCQKRFLFPIQSTSCKNPPLPDNSRHPPLILVKVIPPHFPDGIKDCVNGITFFSSLSFHSVVT